MGNLCLFSRLFLVQWILVLIPSAGWVHWLVHLEDNICRIFVQKFTQMHDEMTMKWIKTNSERKWRGGKKRLKSQNNTLLPHPPFFPPTPYPSARGDVFLQSRAVVVAGRESRGVRRFQRHRRPHHGVLVVRRRAVPQHRGHPLP